LSPRSEAAVLLLVLALLVGGFSFATERFFTLLTLRTVANQVPELVVAAIGLTFVMVTGAIDLSVGSVLALASAMAGVGLVRFELPLAGALLLALAVGLLAGVLNGALTVRLGVPSFLATLGTLEMARGATYLLTRSQTQYVGARIEWMAEPAFLGLSAPFLLAVVLVVLGEVALRRTVFGRHAIAVGANEEAVRFSGIDPRPVRLAAFVLGGGLAAVAGIIYAARLGAADPNAGIGFELQAIAAVVVGGTSLRGGRGSIVGSFLGVLIIAVLGAGLAQAGAQEPTKRLVTGAVIVLAVLADRLRRNSRLGSTPHR
jgi:ribose transport system permease protein